MNADTPFTIEQIKALLDGITPGAWESFMRDSGEFNGYIVEATIGDRNDSCMISEVAKIPKRRFAKNAQDADFIAAAPAIVRQLIAEREAMLARIDTVISESKSVIDYVNALPRNQLTILDSTVISEAKERIGICHKIRGGNHEH